jgi:alginate O-acetyltransferase complex protein AlgI
MLYWFCGPKYRITFLILASLIFYSFSGLSSFFIIVCLACFTYVIGRYLLKHQEQQMGKKRVFLGGISVVVSVLLFFKYGNLLVKSIESVVGFHGEISRLLLPLGISFFTFEFIHYLVDVYYKKIPQHTSKEFFAFAFFFPTLASGPIKRFQTFVQSLRSANHFSWTYFYSGIFYISMGYAQKYLVADNLVRRTYFLAHPDLIPAPMALVSGLFFYSLRIYFDFAGLSNIAIGSALLFGIKVPINFSWPYFRKDLASFWKYWHMSLTSWIRDYVYMPLVFKFRNSKLILSSSFIITMGLIGLWHGSSWNFLCFGLYHGVGLLTLHLWRELKIKIPFRLPKKIAYGIGMVTTFVFVTLGWPLFVTTNLHDSYTLYQKLFQIVF